MESVLLGETVTMRILTIIVIALALILGTGSHITLAQDPAASSSEAPHFTQDGKLEFPENYREWIYLTSGLNMSYAPSIAGRAGHDMFDNVFVNPSAYKAFLQTGTWPDQTILVLEVRGADSKASINQSGHFQDSDVMGREVHLKDNRSKGGWAFYGFDETKPTTPFPHEMDCYSCHEQHGAVDTTFVQFYPTLIKLAEQKGTLREAYKKDGAKR